MADEPLSTAAGVGRPHPGGSKVLQNVKVLFHILRVRVAEYRYKDQTLLAPTNVDYCG